MTRPRIEPTTYQSQTDTLTLGHGAVACNMTQNQSGKTFLLLVKIVLLTVVFIYTINDELL